MQTFEGQGRSRATQSREDAKPAPAPSGRNLAGPAPKLTTSDVPPHLRLLGTVQRKPAGDASRTAVLEAAKAGIQTPSSTLPYADRIQPLFGRHDVSQIKAHQGAEATASATAMKARAYATARHVVFAGTPDLHTAAHEAAHVIQQQAGVQLSGGIGQVGDVYELNADAVADRVTAGQPAEALLDRFASGARPAGGEVIQRQLSKEAETEFGQWLDKWKSLLPLDSIPVQTIIQQSETLKQAKATAIAAVVDKNVTKLTTQGSQSVKNRRTAELKDDPHLGKSLPGASTTLVAELLDSYPAASHHFILLGNSPAVIAPALLKAKARFTVLPLGGLTDYAVMEKVFTKKVPEQPKEQRDAYIELFSGHEKLQQYLTSYLKKIREKNLVLIDYTQSGVSVLAVADMLRAASALLHADKTVKLFTFSKELPNENSILATQADYDLVAAAPVGEQEKAFIEMMDSKAYKDKMFLIMTKSLKINELLQADNADYDEIMSQVTIPELADRLFSLVTPKLP